MSGQSIPILSKRAYSFTNGSGTVVVAKAIPVVNWTQGSLLVRVHEADFGASSQIDVIARVTSPSAEDPSNDFIDTTTAVATVTVDSSTTPALERAALADDFGAFLEIVVSGTLGMANCDATISVDLVVKD